LFSQNNAVAAAAAARAAAHDADTAIASEV